MSKRQLLILLGIWIIVFLFLGFPSAWDKVFALASGAIIVTIALALKPKEKTSPKGAVPFVENRVVVQNTFDIKTPDTKTSTPVSTPITSIDSQMSS